jgi:NTE family protein
MSENADFSPEIIKNLIKEGEEKTNEIINKIRRGFTIEK